MSANYTIGNTPHMRAIVQSVLSDFVWSLPFVDVVENGTETDTDLTGYDFEMVIYEADGTTPLETLTIGSGIEVVGNVVTVSMPLETFAAWTRGCKYKYFLRSINSDGIRKALFADTFTTT